MNELFTIIIPEHNRPNRLKRLLDYFISYGCKNIIVSDSSDVKFKYIDEYQNDIIYEYCPKVHLAEKLSQIFKYIATPYITMCADDDFVIPPAINQSVEFLNNHPEYASSQGLYACFYPQKRMAIYSIYPQMINNSISDESSAERVLHLMTQYYQFYYAVFRTEVFKGAINSIIELNKSCIQNLNLLELYLSMYAVIEGKHAVLPVLHEMREVIDNSAGRTTLGLKELKEHHESKEEYEYFIQKLSKLISQHDNIQFDEGKNIVNVAIATYLNSSICNPVFTKPNIVFRIINAVDKRLLGGYLGQLRHKKKLSSLVSSPQLLYQSINTVKRYILCNYSSVYNNV